MGPVINVTNPALGAACPASTNADWNACFTLASAAAEAASLVGTPSFRIGNFAPGGSSVTSLPVTLAVQAGDTVMAWVIGMGAADTVTVTDDGLNTYNIQQNKIAGTSTDAMVFATFPRAAVAATTITVHDGTSRNLSVLVAAFSNVGDYRFSIPLNATSASTSAPSINDASTMDTNNLWVSGFTWFSGGTVTASQNAGTLQLNTQATSGLNGMALVTQTSASLASVTNSLTLSGASATIAMGTELRSHSEVMPTLYFPQGWYNYSGGLSLLHPGTIKGEPGTVLCYIGTNHVLDIAPTTLNVNVQYRTFYIDGIEFHCGDTASEGIYLNPFAEFVGIRNSTFVNFTRSPAYMIYGTADNYDIEIGPQNRFTSEDSQVRNIAIANANHVDNESFFRIHDNVAACWAGTGENGGCNADKAGIGFHNDGAHSRIYHNNLAFFNPDIWMDCTTAAQCFGNNIESNQLETVPGAGSGTILPPIQFSSNNDGLLVINNTSNNHGASVGLLGPRTGTDFLTGSRINWNQVVSLPNAQALVQLNNLTTNTGNESYMNGCTGSSTGSLPCPVLHTAGGSIPPWGTSVDLWGNCTMNGSTGCPAISFLQVNYTVAPKCVASWNGGGALTGIVKVAVTTTTLTITSSVAGDTAVMNWFCSAGDAQ